MLDDFFFTRLGFKATPEKTIVLPKYKGSTLRGGFGHAFKKSTCVADDSDCDDCMLADNCLYNYVFNTPLPEDSEMMKKYPYAPHPFLIEPPEEKKREYTEEDTIEFNLVLIGRVIDQLSYFVYAFEKLGELGLGKKRGNYELDQVRFDPPQGESASIYSDGSLEGIDTTMHASDLNVPQEDALTFRLRTPMRLKYEGELVGDLEFHVLLRNLLRRTSLLSFFHCDHEMDVEFSGLIEQAKEVEKVEDDLQWYDWERYSGRQDKWIKMGGLTGEVTFRGDMDPFRKLLALGEYLHVGKSTAFGMGRYKIVESQ